MKHLSKLWILLALISLTIACKEEEEDPDPSESITTKEVTLSRFTDYGDEDWIYYSFSQGAELDGITSANYQTDGTWDIAFNRYNVRTNGGTSGAGEAAVVDMGEVEYSSVTEAPADGYTVDGKISIVKEINMVGPPIMMDVNGNELFVGAITPATSQYPTFDPNNHIYVLKTADGNYVKLWITSYFNDNGESGYMNFKYSYQEDGSLILE